LKSANRWLSAISHFRLDLNDLPIKALNHWEKVMAISQELLDILACPKCKGDIYLNETKDGLVCDNCKLCYEIREDIPIMLIDEAKPLED
jgi:uncharacterized protein YbaR (Trm112 family)